MISFNVCQVFLKPRIFYLKLWNNLINPRNRGATPEILIRDPIFKLALSKARTVIIQKKAAGRAANSSKFTNYTSEKPIIDCLNTLIKYSPFRAGVRMSLT